MVCIVVPSVLSIGEVDAPVVFGSGVGEVVVVLYDVGVVAESGVI